MKCREAARRGTISDVVIAQQCLKMDIVQRAPVDMHILGAEYVAMQAQKWMPGAKQKLVLLALGDDILHATAIIDRNKVPVHGFATIGGAASNTIETGQPVIQPSASATSTPIPLGKSLDEMQSPIDVMVRRRVPGLFMWGALSGRLSADLQATFAAAANTTVSMRTIRFGGCYHLLSKHSDEDWMEPSLVDKVATTVREFVDEQLPTPAQEQAKPREQTAGGGSGINAQLPAQNPSPAPRSA